MLDGEAFAVIQERSKGWALMLSNGPTYTGAPTLVWAMLQQVAERAEAAGMTVLLESTTSFRELTEIGLPPGVLDEVLAQVVPLIELPKRALTET